MAMSCEGGGLNRGAGLPWGQTGVQVLVRGKRGSSARTASLLSVHSGDKRLAYATLLLSVCCQVRFFDHATLTLLRVRA